MKENNDIQAPITVFSIVAFEDHGEQIVQMLQTDAMYRSLGYVMSGHVGLEECKVKKPDLVIIDRNIPDIHCLDLAVQGKKMNIGVVMLSAGIEFDWMNKALNLGMNDFVHNPIGQPEFFAILQRAYRRTHHS